VDSSLSPTLTILYTAALRGDLELLPRLFTYLRELRLQALSLPQSHVYLLDLGESCHPDVWHCAITEGRSMLIALDGMGYQAANVEGQLDEPARDRMRDNLMELVLVDAAHPWVNDGLGFCTELPQTAEQNRPWVLMTPAARTTISEGTLQLQRVTHAQVGMAQIQLEPSLILLDHVIRDLPPTTPPDPTIAATIDFIRSEAQFRQRKG
jgi:hypothetical protein